MKKLFAILLALVLILLPIALAESDAPVVTVDLTRILLGVLWLAFDALLAWLAKEIIPPAKRWLDEHTNTMTQERVWNFVCWLVEAAEQTIKGPLRGPERLKYVVDGLRRRGIKVDYDLIEAAVMEMNSRIIDLIDDQLPETTGADIVDDGK